MLDETRTTGCDGVSELPVSQKVKELSGYDRELIGLIGRTAQGDEAALGTLYDKTGSQVYGLAFHNVLLHGPKCTQQLVLFLVANVEFV